MKKYKSLLILLSFIIAISFCGTTISASSIDEVSEDFVSEDLAKIAAVDFMSSLIKLDSSTNWDSNSRIVETQEIYDLDNNVVSYCFKISNAEDQNEGYVMISANKNEFPILEYSFENEPFYDIAIEEISSQIPGIMQETQANDRTIFNPKIYLSDNYNYLAELQIDGIKRTFDITTNNFNEVNKMDYQSKDISYSEDNNQIWDKIVENFNNNMYSSSISRTSNPPDKYNTFITNPGSYESGWQTGYTFNCARYDQTYYTLSQFDGGGVCAPTAATNLCYYYYKLDYYKYKNLRNGTWQSTFNSLKALMETSLTIGTYPSKIKPAMLSYFSSAGISASASYVSGTNNGKKLVSEMNKYGNPIILNLLDNKTYNSSHAVLALGYQQFYYNTYGYSTYIRIADGWTNNANRFVWGNCSGTWSYITVNPN